MNFKLTNVLSISALLFGAMLIYSCGDDASSGSQETSGEIIVYKIGERPFIIDASDITADITVVAGGGGGAGGVDYNGGGRNSSGGGGGGGAGEVVEFKDVSLERGASYKAFVGDGGQGGPTGRNGLAGEDSYIELNGEKIYVARAGSGGKTNDIEKKEGGLGGSGYPNGLKGGDGEDIMPNGEAAAGAGGKGGDNSSGYGKGGSGGVGTQISSNNPIIAKAGVKAQEGYIKITWKGIK